MQSSASYAYSATAILVSECSRTCSFGYVLCSQKKNKKILDSLHDVLTCASLCTVTAELTK